MSDESFPSLPALRSLSKLADIQPRIIIDTREQCPLSFERLASITGTLQTGDYSACGLESDIAIERKSIADLIGSLTCGRERFMREVDRLRAFPFARLLIVGSEAEIRSGYFRSNANPKAIIHSLHSIEARGLPVVFAATAREAARLVERWTWWRARAVVEAANELVRGDRAKAVDTQEGGNR